MESNNSPKANHWATGGHGLSNPWWSFGAQNAPIRECGVQKLVIGAAVSRATNSPATCRSYLTKHRIVAGQALSLHATLLLLFSPRLLWSLCCRSLRCGGGDSTSLSCCTSRRCVTTLECTWNVVFGYSRPQSSASSDSFATNHWIEQVHLYRMSIRVMQLAKDRV